MTKLTACTPADSRARHLLKLLAKPRTKQKPQAFAFNTLKRQAKPNTLKARNPQPGTPNLEQKNRQTQGPPSSDLSL